MIAENVIRHSCREVRPGGGRLPRNHKKHRKRTKGSGSLPPRPGHRFGRGTRATSHRRRQISERAMILLLGAHHPPSEHVRYMRTAVNRSTGRGVPKTSLLRIALELSPVIEAAPSVTLSGCQEDPGWRPCVANVPPAKEAGRAVTGSSAGIITLGHVPAAPPSRAIGSFIIGSIGYSRRQQECPVVLEEAAGCLQPLLVQDEACLGELVQQVLPLDADLEIFVHGIKDRGVHLAG